MKKITQQSRFKIRWLNTQSLVLLVLFAFSPFLKGNAQYCTPSYTSGCNSGDNLNSVVVTGHGTSVLSDLNTGCNGGYLDNTTALSAVDLMQSQTYQVDLNTTYGSPTSEKVTIWIDFDGNSTFDASEKLLADFPLSQSPSFATTSITIPVTAPTGVKRMRVRLVYGSSTTNVDPCNNYSNGETHDYSVNILALPPCSGTPVAGTATVNTRMCASQPLNLTAPGATVASGMIYQWEKSPAGANTFTNLSGATTPNFTVTNQTADTDYRFVVTCIASGVTTTSNVVTALQPNATGPFYEGFDSTPTGNTTNPSPPNCWTYLDNMSGYGYTSTTAGRSANGFYVYRPNATGDLKLISPATDNLGNGTKQVRFWARVSSTTYMPTQKIGIYTMNGTTASATKTLVEDNIPLTTSWQEFIVPLPVTTDDYFAFSFDAVNGTAYMYVDDVYYEDLSPCMYPVGLKTTTITGNSVDFTWTAATGAGVTGYEYEVRDNANNVVATGTTTGTSVQATGLQPGTTYKIYIRSVCGTTKGDWSPFYSTFTTLCVALVNNFYEDFNAVAAGSTTNNTVPNCWTYLKTGTSTSLYGYTATVAGQTGGLGFYTYRPAQSGTSYNGDLMLVSPETVDLGNGTKQIRFSSRRYFTGSYAGELKIYTMNGKTASSTKTLIATINVPDATWKEYIVPLPVTTDDYFAFSFEQEGLAKYIFIDDVYYENLSPCAAPGNISATTITSTSATISWNKSLAAGVTGYEWEVRDLTGVVVKSGTVNNVNTVTANVTGLAPGMYYEVYVRSKCGATPGVWTSVPFKFATLCAVLTGNFFEGFEFTPGGGTTNASQPLCWSYIDTNSGYGYTSTSAVKTATQGFYVYRPNTTGDLLLVSPETANLGGGNKRVRFSARVNSTTYINTQKLEVYTLNANTGTPTKTLVATGFALTNSWQEFIAYLPNTTDDYFAFSFDRNGGTTYIYIDDIYYEDIPPIVLDATKTDILCNGANSGTATVAVEGGKPPYTYAWTPSGQTTATATNLTPGAHTVTVTDNRGISKQTSVVITEPTAILPNLNFTSISCNGMVDGMASVNPTGGVAPYTVLWSNGKIGTSINKLTAGTYDVTVRDANNCPVKLTFTIIEPAVLGTSVNQSDVTAYGGNDGSATVTVTGGTAPYTYAWTPAVSTTDTANNLTAGTYTVLVTDANGCSTTQSITIAQPAIPYQILSVTQNNVSCNGSNDGNIAVTIAGGTPPYNYAWSNAGGNTPMISNLIPGAYTLTVTDADSSVLTATYTITEPAVLNGTISAQNNVSCNGASNGTATVDPVGGTAPYTFLWSNGMTTANAYNLTAGNYSVQITDAKGCKSTTAVTITEPAMLDAMPTVNNITCFGQNDGSIMLNVMGGSAPYSYSWSNGLTTANVSGLAKGTYNVTVTDANNCTVTKTFTITEPTFVYAPVASNQTFCISQNATLQDVVVTGANIKWYSALTGGMMLPATTALTTGTTYYASQTVGTCESTRTPVTITLNQGAPLATSQLSVCSNTRIQNMNVDGFNYTQLKWYATATSATPLASSLLLTTGTYYVSSVVGTCESARKAIQVTVAAPVPAPAASAQTACANITLDDLVVGKDPQATLNWYSSLNSMTPLPGTTQVSTGTYYVQQVIGNCESVRVAVPVQVVNVSAPAMTTISMCQGTTIADFNGSTNSYVWYVNNSTTTPLADTFVITSGTYYIAQQNSGCISGRTPVTVTVNARPNSPTGQLIQTFNTPNKTVSDIVMNQPNVMWFATYNDAFMQINQLPANTLLQDNTTYYGILKGTNNCGSIPTAVKVIISLSNQELDLTQLKYYPNPVDSELNIAYNEEIRKVEVFTITGQRVMSNEYNSNEVKTDLSRLSAGTYLVKVETAKASQFIKVVKR